MSRASAPPFSTTSMESLSHARSLRELAISVARLSSVAAFADVRVTESGGPVGAVLHPQTASATPRMAALRPRSMSCTRQREVPVAGLRNDFAPGVRQIHLKES